MRVLFFLRAINFDRVFESFLRQTLERGHEVHVALELEKARPPEGSGQVFKTLSAEYAGFSFELLPKRRDAWMRTATRLRFALDYLRYLRPEYAGAPALTQRARQRAPRLLRTLAERRAVRGPAALEQLERALQRLEAATPLPDDMLAYISRHRPDLVMVSPLLGLGSAQGDYLRAAAQLGIPSVLMVASWDNLTNKGVVRHAPSLTVVWNEAQVREAVELHGLPPERVVATGAHPFDHWFEWSPSTTADEFAAKVGLAPRPFLLYVCSSAFIAGEEADFVAEWVHRLRTAAQPALRDVGVVIRPHPQNAAFWREAQARVVEPGRTVVWPLGGQAPATSEAKADYFASLSHCRAVVGINTSALIEAAIVRRPVFTILAPRFRSTQEGTLHFAHLTGADGEGLLGVARGWGEHLAHLAEGVDDPTARREHIEGFLRSFIRPHGLEEPAAPRVVDALERAAAEQVAAAPSTGRLAAALRGVTPAVAAYYAVTDLARINPQRVLRVAIRLTPESLRGRVRELFPFLAPPPAPPVSPAEPGTPVSRGARVEAPVVRPVPTPPARVPAVADDGEPPALAAAVPPD